MPWCPKCRKYQEKDDLCHYCWSEVVDELGPEPETKRTKLWVYPVVLLASAIIMGLGLLASIILANPFDVSCACEGTPSEKNRLIMAVISYTSIGFTMFSSFIISKRFTGGYLAGVLGVMTFFIGLPSYFYLTSTADSNFGRSYITELWDFIKNFIEIILVGLSYCFISWILTSKIKRT